MDKETHANLHKKVASGLIFAEWIYQDVRFNCDHMAPTRTADRLSKMHAEYGDDIRYGIAGAWCVQAFERFRVAHVLSGMNPPELLPSSAEEIKKTEGNEQAFRAKLSGQQFFAAISRDDLEMAEDIFLAALAVSLEEAMNLLYAVLSICVTVSNTAFKMRDHGY